MAIPKAIEHMRSGSGSLEIIPITSTDGLTYIGTAKSIKEYKDGMIIGLIPNMNNVATNPITNITMFILSSFFFLEPFDGCFLSFKSQLVVGMNV